MSDPSKTTQCWTVDESGKVGDISERQLNKLLKNAKRVWPTSEIAPDIRQAFKDWVNRLAYIDNNGNYHLKAARNRPSGPIAPWNKAVKRAFADVSEFHEAAKAHEQSTQE